MLNQQEISDRLEIEDLLIRYCYAVDDRNWENYRRIFTPDAIIDDTKTGGIKSNVEDHIIYMKKALSKILLSQHAISTCKIDINGDGATVRTAEGWKIRNRYEDGYWNQNVPKDFKF